MSERGKKLAERLTRAAVEFEEAYADDKELSPRVWLHLLETYSAVRRVAKQLQVVKMQRVHDEAKELRRKYKVR